MKKILSSLIVLGVVAAAAIGLSSAFFSDTETSTGNLLQAGELDLKIDNQSYYNGTLNSGTTWALDNLSGHLFFDFHDIKPSDWGEDTISIHAANDYWACVDINLTKNDDNTCTEPEKLDDPTCGVPNPEPNASLNDGELAQNLNFAFWVDDGDNVLETDETVFKEGPASSILNGVTWILADTFSNLFEASGPLLGTETYYIGKAWCFGTLTKIPVPAGQGVNPSVASGVTCNGSQLNNSTQTDVVMGDIKFTAEQARNNPNFVCKPQTCQVAWASGVVSSSQGTRKDGSAVLPERTDPTDALGPAQSSGLVDDNPVVFGSFFSLGFKIPTPGTGGSIALSYGNPFFDQPGNDIQVYEVTGGAYPDERLKIEASQDGISWTLIAASVSRDAAVDMSPMPWAKYLRLTDVSDINLFEPTADAYDLDGVKVFCGTP